MSDTPQADMHWSDLLLALIIIAALALLTMEIMERFEGPISTMMERGTGKVLKWLDF